MISAIIYYRYYPRIPIPTPAPATHLESHSANPGTRVCPMLWQALVRESVFFKLAFRSDMLVEISQNIFFGFKYLDYFRMIFPDVVDISAVYGFDKQIGVIFCYLLEVF